MSSWTRTKQVRVVRGHSMLAFRSDHPHLLRSAKPMLHIWTSRFTSRPLPIFRSLLHATVKYLEISNVRIAILKIAVQLCPNRAYNPRPCTQAGRSRDEPSNLHYAHDYAAAARAHSCSKTCMAALQRRRTIVYLDSCCWRLMALAGSESTRLRRIPTV